VLREAFSLVEVPSRHTSGASAEALKFGSALTVTIKFAVFLQELRSVPVTVYVMFPAEAGVTLTEAAVEKAAPVPIAQEYVDAPPALSVVLWFRQMLDGAADAITDGAVKSEMVMLFDSTGQKPSSAFNL